MQQTIVLPLRRALPLAAAALFLAAAAPAASAIRPVVKINGSAVLTHVSGSRVTPARFHVDTTFTTDTPGAQQPFTIQKAVIYFPDHAGTNGRLFPSCNARQITRFHGNLARCPKGSQIGSGIVKASAIQLDVHATGQVALFNSNHGKSITIHVRTVTPALIDRSFDAPLTQLHGGRYGEKLTLVIPHSLQEILSGVFVAVSDFNVTLTGAVRVHGVEYSYLKAPACPKTPLHGVFDFMDWTSGQSATATVDSKVHCTVH